MGDFNDNINGSLISQFFDSVNLLELIQLNYGTKSPNTFVNGSVTIDGIFGTRELGPVQSG
jgi:hypothetical protein